MGSMVRFVGAMTPHLIELNFTLHQQKTQTLEVWNRSRFKTAYQCTSKSCQLRSVDVTEASWSVEANQRLRGSSKAAGEQPYQAACHTAEHSQLPFRAAGFITAASL